mmetsp:Transcript_36005/g.95574  ORF Transcript_36005/g.95574 Transcript_36005/m.95574 type:complete len:337 (-) Transcript_36005:370-1380(-)
MLQNHIVANAMQLHVAYGDQIAPHGGAFQQSTTSVRHARSQYICEQITHVLAGQYVGDGHVWLQDPHFSVNHNDQLWLGAMTDDHLSLGNQDLFKMIDDHVLLVIRELLEKGPLARLADIVHQHGLDCTTPEDILDRPEHPQKRILAQRETRHFVQRLCPTNLLLRIQETCTTQQSARFFHRGISVPIHGLHISIDDNKHPIADLTLPHDLLLPPKDLHRARACEKLAFLLLQLAEIRIRIKELHGSRHVTVAQLFHALPEPRPIHPPENTLPYARDGGGATHVVQHGKLPESLRRPQLLHVTTVDGDSEDTVLDHITAVSFLALRENRVTRAMAL